MEKNKSIDGLTTRRSKTKAAASSKTKSTTRTTKTTKSTKTAASSKPKASRTSSTKPVARSTSTKTRSKTSTKTSSTTATRVRRPAAKATPTPKPTKNTPSANKEQEITPEVPTTAVDDFLKPVQAFEFDEQTGELKASDHPISTKAKSKKEKKPISKKRKIITGIALAIVILLIGAVIWFIIWGNDILAKITGGQGNIFDLFTETYTPLKTDENGRTNILAFGTSGYNMEGEEGNGVHDGAQLTDSIMVISLDQNTGDVAMLSLPRDLKASPTCTATGKINEVYWCNNMDENDEKAGAEALMTELNDILGVDFQYYAHLNWGSLVQIVDTLGGINVTLDEDIEDYYYTGAVFEAGVPYTINGGQALGLARARHGTASGDFSRGASQQKILIGIKDKVLEKQLSLTDLISLAGTLGDNLRTNFSVDEMKTLAHIVTDIDLSNMRQVSLLEPEKLMTTGEIGGISYVIPVGGAGNYGRIQSYIAKMFSSDPRKYEDSTILVLNATDAPGVASNEKSKLESEGYANIDIDDTTVIDNESDYILYSITDKAPGTKKLLEEKYGTAKSADSLPAGVPTEYDFVIIVNKNNDNN